MPKNKINRILIVYKKSSYQVHALSKKNSRYLKLLKEKNIVIRRSKTSHEIHLETIESVKASLHKLKIPFDIRLRYNLSTIKGYDLVITIGGDGTFLETSHYLNEGYLMGINSVPDESIGYYCKATAETFLEKLFQFIEGKARIQPLHRLNFTIQGLDKEKVTGFLALNDILFANKNPAGTTRYLLKVGHTTEEQKSSGVWIAPAAGSTAAIHSAGGKVLPIASTKFQYFVREPYEPRGKYKLKNGILTPGSHIEIMSTMDNARLYVDGPHISYKILRGSRVVIQASQNPIMAIW
ncbi:MAG: NAD(+)/NADH kinase [Deltaproteobacteria bacterium]|nr:MAG: NAD(+)/NADH kinase [Deltaproteobacteria bacterium]